MNRNTATRKAQEAALKYAARQHRYRADMIANTELAYAYNMGAHEGVRQAMKQGLMGVCEKIWTTAGDHRVCTRCRTMSGERIGFDEPFSRGNRVASGYELVPPAHPRCRCTVAYEEIAPPMIKPLNVGGESGKMKTKLAQGGEEKIDWPKFDRSKVISKEQFIALRAFANECEIDLRGFKGFDGDVEVAKDIIGILARLRDKFPVVADKHHRLSLGWSWKMDADDFAITKGRVVTLNAAVFRKIERLEEEYQKQVSKHWFVNGTNWKAIIHHEFGHILAQELKINSLKIVCEMIGKGKLAALNYAQEQLSDYAGYIVDGSEIISEVFSDMTKPKPCDFSRLFMKKVSEQIKKG